MLAYPGHIVKLTKTDLLVENVLVTCGKLLSYPHKIGCACGKKLSYPHFANRFSTSYPPSYPQKRASYPQLTLDNSKKISNRRRGVAAQLGRPRP